MPAFTGNGGTAAPVAGPYRNRARLEDHVVAARRRRRAPSLDGGLEYAPGQEEMQPAEHRVRGVDFGVPPSVSGGRPPRHSLGGGGLAAIGNQRGIGQNQRADLGNQLGSRLQRGVIDEDQAERTMRERQLLEQSLGEDWRQQLFGGEGRVKRLRAEAATENEGSDRARQILEQLMQLRRDALMKARADRPQISGGQVVGA